MKAIRNMSWKLPFRRQNNGAFTLIEVLVSLAILAIAVVSLLVEKNRSFQEAVQTHNYRKALRLGYQKLTEIQQGIELNKEGTFETEQTFTWKVREEPLFVETEQGQLELVKWILEVEYGGETPLQLTAMGSPPA